MACYFIVETQRVFWKTATCIHHTIVLQRCCFIVFYDRIPGLILRTTVALALPRGTVSFLTTRIWASFTEHGLRMFIDHTGFRRKILLFVCYMINVESRRYHVSLDLLSSLPAAVGCDKMWKHVPFPRARQRKHTVQGRPLTSFCLLYYEKVYEFYI